jgi:Xaa-Pro aminopeptidase
MVLILSNEPGYYELGNFGIRIENPLVVKPKDFFSEGAGTKMTSASSSSATNFLQFEHLTIIRIQKSLVDLSLVMDEELDWLDS